MTGTAPSVIVDCDPGIDDALALTALAHHHRARRISLDLVTVVAGNASLARVAANARFVLDANGVGSVPVLAGGEGPMAAPVGAVDRVAVHGSDGMGGCFPTGRPVPAPALGAVEAIVAGLHSARRARRRAWLLSLGPMTNLAGALAAEPRLPELVERVVVMGGTFAEPRSTVAPGVEFNVGSDPGAARDVLAAGLPLTLVPLDVTMQVIMGTTETDVLDRRAGGRVLATTLLRRSIEHHRAADGVDGAPMHDPLAAAVLLAPSVVVTRPRRVAAVGEGDGAGTLTTGDGPPVEVALEVDVDRAKRLLLGVLAGDD